MQPPKLSTNAVEIQLNTFNYSPFHKPGRNKGERGQLIELALGIPNSQNLKDLIDGEFKTFTIGESIAVTSLKHCLPAIIEESVEFENSKVFQKLEQTIYIGFTRRNEFVASKTINVHNSPKHYQELAEDYGYISAKIKEAYVTGTELHTINGPNELLQIRTKASKSSTGYYKPLYYNNVQLNNKYMAFYLCASFGKQVVDKSFFN